MSLHLGLDLGGTSIKWAVLDADRQTVASGNAATHGDRGPEAVVESVIDVGRDAITATGAVATIGVGVPGLYDRARGTTRFITNIAGDWSGIAVGGPVAAALGAPTELINDARAFALAESVLGAGRGCRTVVCLTLGTGVGGGIVVGGRLYEGLDGQAGELGHQTVDPSPDAPVCGCGNRGCVEAIYRADRLGDAAARERVSQALAIAIGNAVLTLTPERIVIGGGVAAVNGESLLETLRQIVGERVTVAPIGELVAAELGPGAGAIGAALRGLDGATRA